MKGLPLLGVLFGSSIPDQWQVSAGRLVMTKSGCKHEVPPPQWIVLVALPLLLFPAEHQCCGAGEDRQADAGYGWVREQV